MSNANAEETTRNRKLRFVEPHIFAILFFFIVLMALCTRVIPAGVYKRIPIEVEGAARMMVDPTSYHRVERTPVSLLGVFMSIPQGFAEAAAVIAVTFCVGGAFGVVKRTGAISIGVAALARRMSRRGIMVIPVLMVAFAAIAAFIGTQELSLIYVPSILPLMLALGFDSMTAAATALCATTAGFTGAITNPFTVGLAQKISDVPLYSGAGYRFVVLVVLTSVTILYVMRYASRVRRDPSKSLVRETDARWREEFAEEDEAAHTRATTREILAGVSAVLMFAWMIWGVLAWKWEMVHMGGMLLAIGLVSGLLGGLNPNAICRAFEEGFGEVLLGAMIMGVARGVAVVMTQGQIIDTVIFYMARMTQHIPPAVNAVGMFVAQSGFNFLVSSGSGQAVITMPIMAPLADLVGVTRQVSILAFQLGDGLSNIIFPTSGYFMAVLALARIPWDRWLRFMLPLFLIESLLGSVFLVIAQLIGWQ